MKLDKGQRDKIISKLFDAIGVEKLEEALAERGIRILTPELEQSLRIEAAIGAISAVNSFKAEEPKKETKENNPWHEMTETPYELCMDVLIVHKDALKESGALRTKSVGYKTGNSWKIGGIAFNTIDLEYEDDYMWRYL